MTVRGASCFSPALRTDEQLLALSPGDYSDRFATLLGPDLEGAARLTDRWAAFRPAAMAASADAARLARIPSIHVQTGSDDSFFEGTARLHIALRDAGIRHRFRVIEAGHDWPAWQSMLEDALLHVDAVLSRGYGEEARLMRRVVGVVILPRVARSACAPFVAQQIAPPPFLVAQPRRCACMAAQGRGVLPQVEGIGCHQQALDPVARGQDDRMHRQQDVVIVDGPMIGPRHGAPGLGQMSGLGPTPAPQDPVQRREQLSVQVDGAILGVCPEQCRAPVHSTGCRPSVVMIASPARTSRTAITPARATRS